MKTLTGLACASALAFTIGAADAQTRGVTDDSIVIGTLADLSGPLAIGGVPTVNAIRIRFDEVNAAGGVHGRKLDFRVEDMKYDLPQAARATNRLVQRDGIFAMLSSVGTPPNLAAMQVLDKAGIPNLFPVTAARAMVEPFNPLHFSVYADYSNQANGALKYFHEHQGVEKICVQAAGNDYGQEVMDGIKASAEALGVEIVLVGTHRITETEFAGPATAIKNSDCGLLMLGTTVRDTISIYTTVRQLGWDKPVVGNMVPYLPLIAEAGGGATEGLYLVAPYLIADFTDGDEFKTAFHAEYVNRYGEAPNIYAQMGYNKADLLIQALETAGRDLTVEGLIAGIEAISLYEDRFGGPSYAFGPEKHDGGTTLILVQSKNKAWEVIETDLPY